MFQKSIKYTFLRFFFSCTNFLIFFKTPIPLFSLQFIYSICLLHVKFLSKKIPKYLAVCFCFSSSLSIKSLICILLLSLFLLMLNMKRWDFLTFSVSLFALSQFEMLFRATLTFLNKWNDTVSFVNKWNDTLKFIYHWYKLRK